MKKFSVLAMTAVVAMGMASSCDSNRKAVSLKSDIDSVSYIIGASYGEGLREQIKQYPGKAGNVDALIDGFIKAAKGDSVFLGKNQQQAQEYVNSYFQTLQTRVAEETLKEGQDFLAANKSKDGVITTESGLQYKVVSEGTGIKPTLEDTVLVNYTGKLLDGTVFDSNEQRGEPIRFALNQVIRGWSEGVQLMPKGSKYTLWIPAELAYGQQSPSQLIKPNSTLQFEVELVDVIKK